MENQSSVKVVGFIDPKSFEKKSTKKVEKPIVLSPKPGKVRLGDTVTLMSGRQGEVTGFTSVKNEGTFLLLNNDEEVYTDAHEDFILSIVHKKIEVKKKQQVELPKQIIHFFKDRNKKVIGRLESGKICIFDFTYRGEFVKDNEDWEVSIKEELENKAIVIPIRKVVSQEENEAKLSQSLSQLKDKDWNRAKDKSYQHIKGHFVPLQKVL